MLTGRKVKMQMTFVHINLLIFKSGCLQFICTVFHFIFIAKVLLKKEHCVVLLVMTSS